MYLKNSKIIVIKIGSSLLIDENKTNTILKALHQKFLKEEECNQ